MSRNGANDFQSLIEGLRSTNKALQRLQEKLDSFDDGLYQLEHNVKELISDLKREVQQSSASQRNLNNDMQRWLSSIPRR